MNVTIDVMEMMLAKSKQVKKKDSQEGDQGIKECAS